MTDMNEDNINENAADRLELDASRYRWLRQAGAWESEIGMDLLSVHPALFDAAVDNQMEEERNRVG